MTEVKKVEMYRCPDCVSLYDDEERAARCCNGTCPRCGGKLGRRQAWSGLCRKCRDDDREKAQADKWLAAPKVVWGVGYDGPIYCGDDYYDEPADLIDAFDQMPRTGTWAVEEVGFGLYPDQVIALVEESDEVYEDYEMPPEAVRAIERFCARWNRIWPAKSLRPSGTAVVVTEEWT